MNANNPGKGAFTLIELLVVVSIIALLIAMLVPSMETAFDSARRAACATNLHTIHVGTYQYATSNQGDVIACRGRQNPRSFDSAKPYVTSHGPADAQNKEDATVDWLAALAGVGLAGSAKELVPGGASSQHRPLDMWQCPSARPQRVQWGGFGQYTTAYSYMGGIGRRQWYRRSTGVSDTYKDPPSPDKLPTSKGSWMLASDNTWRYQGTWNPSFLNHPTGPNKGPSGSNQVFVDGGAEWIEANRLFVGHSFYPVDWLSFMYQSEHPDGFTVSDADRPAAY